MILAYALAKKRTIAAREWTFEKNGITIECKCEKGRDCQEDGVIYRPLDNLELQMKSQIGKFRAEYQVPEFKQRFFQIREGQPYEEKKLKVPAKWTDPELIKKVRENFDKLKSERR